VPRGHTLWQRMSPAVSAVRWLHCTHQPSEPLKNLEWLKSPSTALSSTYTPAACRWNSSSYAYSSSRPLEKKAGATRTSVSAVGLSGQAVAPNVNHCGSNKPERLVCACALPARVCAHVWIAQVLVAVCLSSSYSVRCDCHTKAVCWACMDDAGQATWLNSILAVGSGVVDVRQ